MIAVLGGQADFERDLIRTRTGEGRARAKQRGQHMLRPAKITVAQKQEARSTAHTQRRRIRCRPCPLLWKVTRRHIPNDGMRVRAARRKRDICLARVGALASLHVKNKVECNFVRRTQSLLTQSNISDANDPPLEEIEEGVQAETILTEEEDSDEGALDLPNSAFTPINFSSANRRIIDLYRAYSIDKELDPRPSFQRGYVWDRNRATKLIESILLHVPLPLIYTAEEETGTEVVIDGQQRLTTCFAFIEGFFPMSKTDVERAGRNETVKRKPFKLGKMKILSHLQGKSYADLPKDHKIMFERYNLQTIKISKDSHPDVKFEIFERLNTGSVSLSDQEIRNCIYRGPYNDLISKIATADTFRKLLGIAGEANRMQDVELVFRFMAFNEATHLNYNQKMRAFLNGHMRDRRNISGELAHKYKVDFFHAVELSYTVFGDKAFR
jgi:hypothetical protein